MGPPSNLQAEPGRSSLEPPWTINAGPSLAVVSSAPRARARVPRILGCSVCYFLTKAGGSARALIFVAIIFQYKQLQAVYMDAFIFSTTSCVQRT